MATGGKEAEAGSDAGGCGVGGGAGAIIGEGWRGHVLVAHDHS